MKILQTPVAAQVEEMENATDLSRRKFFKLAGGIAGVGVLLSACNPKGKPTSFYLGSGDTALLNFIYLLQQIEAAFYTQAVATPYYMLDHKEMIALTDVRDQEIAHREFLKTLLGSAAIKAIIPDFSSVTFADRASVLTHAATIEDLAVAGLNGASTLFVDTTYAVALSKMVTVEARHSAYFRDILTLNSFGDNVVDANGADQALSPSTVLQSVGVYTHTRFDSSNLPN